MNGETSISINGILYDMHTGLRVDTPESKSVASSAHIHKNALHAGGIHSHTQHSKTLNRRVVRAQKPVMKSVATPAKQPITRSPQITRFAPAKPSQPVSSTNRVISDFGPVAHPAVQKAKLRTPQTIRPALTQRSTPSSKTAQLRPTPAKQQKEKAIKKALHSAKPAKAKKISIFKHSPRTLSIASVSLAVLLLAGYFSYVNMPNLSVRLAAAQAGIAASYPSYRPDGYSLNGPVAYAQGQVSMKFASNGSPQNFTLRQTKSNWDSSAVLSNYVQPKSAGNYNVYTSNGLTIYTFGDSAAWVNGGILYTIDGNASLSNTQLSQLATSM